MKASFFNKLSPRTTLHVEHIIFSISFGRLFDINDDLLQSDPAGSLKLSKNINTSLGFFVASC